MNILPAPWRVAPKGRFIVAADNRTVCDLLPHKRDANAALIAMAPRLHAVLLQIAADPKFTQLLDLTQASANQLLTDLEGTAL